MEPYGESGAITYNMEPPVMGMESENALGLGANPFETGLGGQVGGEVHVDGTAMRLSVFIILAILILLVFHQGGFRFHVTV